MQSSYYKGFIEPLILQVLAEKGEMYGYEITQYIKTKTAEELRLTEGALYPLLHRLEGEGHLSVRHEMVGNRLRKYYQLTETGKAESNRQQIAVIAFLQQFFPLFNTTITPI